MSGNDESRASGAGGSKRDRDAAKRPRAGRTRVSADGLAPAAGREGAPPSNTAPNSCNGVFFQPLRWGVDSLYLSYAGQLFEPVSTQLDELKRQAQSNDAREVALAQFPLGDHLFEVKDKGARLFPYILDDAAFRLQLAKLSKAIPMAYCKVSSGYLAYRRPPAVEVELRTLLAELGAIEGEGRASRIDLFVDFCSTVQMDSWGREAWITRAPRRSAHSVGDRFSGWSIGLGGAIGCRLYDKTLEIQTSGKDYLRELWRKTGWDGTQPVWRLEVQFEREILTQLGLDSLASVLDAQNGLWGYALTEWLRLAVPNPDDKTRSRWPIHPLWMALASIDWESDGGPLLRRFPNQRAPSEKYLARQGLGAVSSYMALNNVDAFWEGWSALGQRVYDFLATDAHFEGVHPDVLLLEKVRLKGRKFNSLNNRGAAPEVTQQRQLAQDIHEYKRQSDGF